MVITNKTTITPAAVNAAMRASNFSNNKYKKIKIIYNFFGLLFGIMFVRYMSLQLLGSREANKGFTIFFAIGTAVFLFIGMYGMDMSKSKMFKETYADMIGVTMNYEIHSEGVDVKFEASGSKQNEDKEAEANVNNYAVLWKDISFFEEDVDYFFLFTDDKTALIIKKSEFIDGSISDLKELLNAVLTYKDSIIDKNL